MFNNYLCEYRKTFPVDEYGRLAESAILSDVGHSTKVLQRLGVVIEHSLDNKFLRIQDKEHPAWQFWIAFNDVDIDLHIKKELRVNATKIAGAG